MIVRSQRAGGTWSGSSVGRPGPSRAARHGARPGGSARSGTNQWRDQPAEVVEPRVRAVHGGRELLDEDAARLVVTLGVEQDVEAHGTTVARHKPAVRVVHPELAGLSRPELEDSALDAPGLDLV